MIYVLTIKYIYVQEIPRLYFSYTDTRKEMSQWPIIKSMLVLIDLINTSRCSKTKANTSISQEKGFFFLHNHHPWIPLPKVIGKTLVFVSSILLKRYNISYLSISVFSICLFICICGVKYTYNIIFFLSCRFS